MTFFETAGQARVFLLLLYAGGGAGIIYDLLSPLRRKKKAGITAAADGLWCLLTAALCFSALVLGGEGEMRLYALLGLCCGAGIYSLGIRSLAKMIGRLFRKKRPNPA